MSQYLGAFLDEAGDNLKQLVDLILLVENDTSNPDAINEIFRSAHTLKGSRRQWASRRWRRSRTPSRTCSTECGKESIPCVGKTSTFCSDLSIPCSRGRLHQRRGTTHSVETEALVASIRASVKADRSVETAKTTKEEPLSGQDEEWIREARGLGMNVYEVRVVLSPSCLLKAARAYMVVSRLEELGDLIKTIPPVEALENEQFSQEFTVYVSTGSGSEQIEATLSRVSELAAVEVRELGVAQVPEPKAEPSAQEADSVTVEEEIIPHPKLNLRPTGLLKVSRKTDRDFAEG